MIGEFVVERFVQKEKSFGIKVDRGFWINGFGDCPQIIKEGELNLIPYHEVKKGENTYYNYGESRKTLPEAIDELRAEMSKLWVSVNMLKADLDVLKRQRE